MAHPFRAKTGGGQRHAANVPDRAAHAQALLRALDALPDLKTVNLPGVYIEVESPPNERLKKESLDTRELSLLRSSTEDTFDGPTEKATVFATPKGVEQLRTKISDFESKDKPARVKNGALVPGGPKNADLVQSLGAITEAGLRALWRSPPAKFPADGIGANWEIWLDPLQADAFIAAAAALGVLVGMERLRFPEDVVVIGHATRDALAAAVRRLGAVRALAAPTVTADFFDSLDVIEQANWVQNFQQRCNYQFTAASGYVTLLDTGVSRAHPLIQPALDAGDRHAANPAWGLEDLRGHGTQLAGLALYGDLTNPLQTTMQVTLSHRLESVKLLPDAGVNPHHLLGAVTRDAVNIVEAAGPRRRTFTMAATTGEDTPHDGAPTSWSSELDQLTAGASGANLKRLMLISAGNTITDRFGAGNYLDVCDHPDHEIESPAQSWNAICVGAFTEKMAMPQGQPLAPLGDLSPSSRTASWNSHWPLKPDVVLEGGNWVVQRPPPPMRSGTLSLLSTHHQFPQRSFSLTGDTSGATALAAKGITELWNDYPGLWPETIRALYVSSARWTPQMHSHLPQQPQKGDFARLFQRYGYGVPDLARARRSASNALTLLIEDEIIPYALSPKTGEAVNKEMRLFTLPWPVDELRKLGTALITLRVALSSFIAPNPSEPARGSRYRYASHNLRFKLNRAGENAQQFMARISKGIESDGPQNEEGDQWDYGSVRRDVGSLHIDQLTCRASDLARRNLIAVHPVTGWWKSKSRLANALPTIRFSLVIEIDAEAVDADIYTEVDTAVKAIIAAKTVIQN